MMTAFWIGKAVVGVFITICSFQEALRNKKRKDSLGFKMYLMVSIATLLFTGVDTVIIFELLKEVF